MTAHKGLSTAEAAEKLRQVGPNSITQKSATGPLGIFLSQFKSLLVGILLGASALSFALGDPTEAFLILAIVVLNAILGFVQEYRAEKALAALKNMTVIKTRVMRDGAVTEIDSVLLVPGDIVMLEEGDKVPADAILLETIHTEVNEAALTGESMPVAKDAGDTGHNGIYMGTIVTHGRAVARVETTGMHTKFGKIAAALSTIRKEDTPLAKKLDGVARQIGLLALAAGIIIIIAGLIAKDPLITILLTSISLAVAAVPEGLPAVITITLAIGVQRMARRKAILRKLAAIEALGSITVIATDKTGTLTKNEMRVVRVWMDNATHVAGSKQLTRDHPVLEKFLSVCVLCNNASLAPIKDHGSFDVIGDKTEGALLLFAASHGITAEHVNQSGERIEEFGFDATIKAMTVLWKSGGGTFAMTKGAPEVILKNSTHIHTTKGIIPIGPDQKARVQAEFEKFAAEGLRVIAIAIRKMDWKNQNRKDTESNLTFLGFVGIADPPREEVAQAIRLAAAAGIRTVMVTGDSQMTAMAIAREIGMLTEGDETITGEQMAKLIPEQLAAKISRIRVFARTTPEQKLLIVRTLQARGNVVAATGDGVNDALALKRADVGVAMGITGTDVAKEAAEMIVTDDNYATIVSAVEEGRAIFDNMKASITYLIGCNIGEILAIVGGVIFGWSYILSPTHILFVNLVTDGLPAIALALKPKSHDLMRRAPRTSSGLFTKSDVAWFAQVSVLAAAATLVAFYLGLTTGNVTVARTLAFTVIVLAQQYIFLDVFAARQSIFSPKVFRSVWLLLPLTIMIGQFALINIPVFQSLFRITKPPDELMWASVILCTGILVVSEIRKAIHRFS